MRKRITVVEFPAFLAQINDSIVQMIGTNLLSISLKILKQAQLFLEQVELEKFVGKAKTKQRVAGLGNLLFL
ncbi:hypothetical protein [Legionella sp. 16cNR16C]|uniref:hypothetical protein n=1 Tax=Legionella sp. 16cNR16C TaxID=2905656 RepID=UPI001E2D3FB1|nr:hypothetical protein [Legionella sp. 16cNR16C]MCE3043471.1 hypothetical protein [Legionella sp. 16cNR16C]